MYCALLLKGQTLLFSCHLRNMLINLSNVDKGIFFDVHSTEPNTTSIKEKSINRLALSLPAQLRDKANIRLIKLKQKTTEIESNR